MHNSRRSRYRFNATGQVRGRQESLHRPQADPRHSLEGKETLHEGKKVILLHCDVKF